eukprot:650506-Karenia_brevis.AAC.1
MAIDEADRAQAAEQKERDDFDSGGDKRLCDSTVGADGDNDVFYFGSYDTPAEHDPWAASAQRNQSQ